MSRAKLATLLQRQNQKRDYCIECVDLIIHNRLLLIRLYELAITYKKNNVFDFANYIF